MTDPDFVKRVTAIKDTIVLCDEGGTGERQTYLALRAIAEGLLLLNEQYRAASKLPGPR